MRIFTVGHSTHAAEAFVALLRTHGVTAVADVRSAPCSRFNPQFNRETLARALEAQRIRYVFLGRELGARPDDPACYEDGRVRYARLARTQPHLFASPEERIEQAYDARAADLAYAREDAAGPEREPPPCD